MNKKLQILFLSFITFALFSSISAQTITVDDGGSCFNNLSFVLEGTLNGKNRYTNNFSDSEIVWDNSRWELRVISVPSLVSHTNTFASTPNPPCLGTGTWNNENIGCNHLIQFFGGGCQNFLPVELSRFYSTVEGTKVELKWQTESEISNEGFQIERSQDGKAYTALGFVRGQGDINETHEYSFVDEKPIIGMNYYRLKQMDYDGAFEYSDVRSVKFTDSRLAISVSPNPTQSGTFTLYLPETEATTIEMTLYDYTGRLVRQNQIEQLQTDISVADLEKGIYLIRVDMEGVTAWERLVVQ